MMDSLTTSYGALFLIISLGIILGRFEIKGLALDLSGVIFIALVLGHFGFTLPADFQKIGLLLFIFTIGIQSGPGFFESFRKYGIQLIIVTISLIFTGALVTVLLAWIFQVDFKLAVGLFTGALTSTPGLAAAVESSKSVLASIGYGIAYPFGVIGVILFVRLLPRILKIDLKNSAQEYFQEARADYPTLNNQNFVVENVNLDGKSIGELHIAKMTCATISRVMHNGMAITPSPETKLYLGDLIKAVGDAPALERVTYLIGKPTTAEIPLSSPYDVQWVLVTNRDVVNKRLIQLHLTANYNATVTRIRRSGIDIAPMPLSQLHFGDRLMIACDKENMRLVTRLLGNEDKRLSETDFLPIALGIVLGILVGAIEVPLFGGLTFSPGMTGGVLTVALILSRIGKTGPIIWSMSGPANQLMRQLGLLFFLAAVGTDAGAHLAEILRQNGLLFFVIGIVITLVPMFVAWILGHYVFKMNFLTLLGVITGGMTSTPGLAAIDPMTECNAPHVGYAAVYPLAMVLVIICSQIIGRL
ncbi:transporter [candidate division KSB1 bacterium]|nr:transporter [candidate division KSB1 bacterium]